MSYRYQIYENLNPLNKERKKERNEIEKSSSTYAFVHLLHKCLAATETHQTFNRSCLVDFSKAFDRIDYNILISKLRIFNLHPILVNCMCDSFVRNRQQRVKLRNI